VRELHHVVEKAVVLGRHSEIRASDLPGPIHAAGHGEGPTFSGDIIPIRELERRYAAWALQQLGGQKGRTAERLGIDEKTLARWLNPKNAGE
jgi:two-component system response regulator HydG